MPTYLGNLLPITPLYGALLASMHVNLGNLLRQTGKSVLQLARETGLNRNTITALMQDKEGMGVRLSTLAVFEKTYGWNIADMILQEADKRNTFSKTSPWYRQEGELIPFTCWPWLIASCTSFAIPHVEEHAQEGRLYIKKDYGYVYWPEETCSRWSKRVYDVYTSPDRHEALYEDYLRATHRIERLYLSFQQTPLSGTDTNLNTIYKDISEAFRPFWYTSLFIDAFDVGVDQKLIQHISKHHGLTSEETKILLTTRYPTFDRERRLDVLDLTQTFIRQSTPFSTWIDTSSAVQSHLRRWAFVRNNYTRIGSYTHDDIKKELEELIKDPKGIVKEKAEIEGQTEETDKQVHHILKTHRLQENPLAFFQLLTYWREHRKKVNLMGIHILLCLINELEKRTGISADLLKYLAPNEFEAVIRGTVSKETLETRRETGIMAIMTADGYRVVTGKEAASLKEECEATRHTSLTEQTILYGQIACQGYAKGTARVILSEQDFARFKDGDILVTGMTRPEFVPLMRRAAGIVTNEGGVTCHAAIVSRELGKPCIIGTRRATDVIKEGDLVEVRAHHGTVRILERT